MKTIFLTTILLAVLVFTALPLTGQRVVHTNVSAADEEAFHRVSAEISKLKQRTTQALAETEAAMRTNVTFLTSRDGSLETAYLLKQQRLIVVKSLIGVIESTNSRAAKAAAATVLGDYRALEAIPCLVSNIHLDLTYGPILVSIVTEDQRKPFGAALANIGEPGVPTLLDRIYMEDSDPVSDRCIDVIVRIVGKERAVGLFRAHLEGAKDDPELQSRFKRVLAKAET